MVIGVRLRTLREERKFSQGEIEKRTGLLRCYISRVEHGHTIPAVETLEKFALALEVPMYQLFYDGDHPPELPNRPKRETEWGSKGKDAEVLAKFRKFFSRMGKDELKLIVNVARKIVKLRA